MATDRDLARSVSAKPKFPRAVALDVAREIVAAIKPVTARLIVAGSLRRRKPEVGDVELLYLPKWGSVKIDLFGPPKELNLATAALDALVTGGVLSKRLNARGAETWGPKNKLALHLASGVPVDLFQAEESSWWNYLVCRTGSAESNVRIAAAARARGWAWHPYGEGFMDEYGRLVRVTCERDVFTLLGLPYPEPWQR